MAKRIMIDSQIVGVVEGKQARRRLLQKARAYCRERRGSRGFIWEREDVLKITGYWEDIFVWIYDDGDIRTPASEGLSVEAVCGRYGDNGPGSFDNQGGYQGVEVGWERVYEEYIAPSFLGGSESNAMQWAHNWGTELPSCEKRDGMVERVANSPICLQAHLKGVRLNCLP